eukprot:GHVS01080992.1.p1 GENE.GHVS01080992.1~~GHVS01080992.1.p1  ORF type:complete len:627 (-),score=215.38 GHVS01080992.1:170-1891(-)
MPPLKPQGSKPPVTLWAALLPPSSTLSSPRYTCGGPSKESVAVPPFLSADQQASLSSFLHSSNQFFNSHDMKLKIHTLPMRLPDWCEGSLDSVIRSNYEIFPFTTIYRHKQNLPHRIRTNWSYVATPTNKPTDPRNASSPFRIQYGNESLREHIDGVTDDLTDSQFSGALLTIHTKTYCDHQYVPPSPPANTPPLPLSKVVGGALVEALSTNEYNIKCVWVHCGLSARSTRLVLQAFLPRLVVECFALAVPLEEGHCEQPFVYAYNSDMDFWPRQGWPIMGAPKFMGLHTHYEHYGQSMVAGGHRDILRDEVEDEGGEEAMKVEEAVEEVKKAKVEVPKKEEGEEEGSGRNMPKKSSSVGKKRKGAKGRRENKDGKVIRRGASCPCWEARLNLRRRNVSADSVEKLIGCSQTFMLKSLAEGFSNKEQEEEDVKQLGLSGEAIHTNHSGWRLWDETAVDTELKEEINALVPVKTSDLYKTLSGGRELGEYIPTEGFADDLHKHEESDDAAGVPVWTEEGYCCLTEEEFREILSEDEMLASTTDEASKGGGGGSSPKGKKRPVAARRGAKTPRKK